jgi:hypothetical protein
MLFQPRLLPDGYEGEDWIGMTLQRVRVVPLARGANHGNLTFYLYAGILNSMLFDPSRWK